MSHYVATQIDPPGCGCTECITGQYVPLDQATPEQVFAMLAGDLSDATSCDFTVTVKIENPWNDIAWTASAEVAREYGKSARLLAALNAISEPLPTRPRVEYSRQRG